MTINSDAPALSFTIFVSIILGLLFIPVSALSYFFIEEHGLLYGGIVTGAFVTLYAFGIARLLSFYLNLVTP
jgi:hypothetical protein